MCGRVRAQRDKVGLTPGELGGSEKSESLLQLMTDIIGAEARLRDYMPQWTHYDEVCGWLQSGINIVTTRTEFLNPAPWIPRWRERSKRLAQRGTPRSTAPAAVRLRDRALRCCSPVCNVGLDR